MKAERELDGKLFWSTSHAAAYFDVHPNTVRNWVRRSYVQGVFIGMRLYVLKSDLDLMVAKTHSA